MRNRDAFTLIELLVTIAIVAILAVVVVLVLNPAQLLQQARDSNRLSDLASMNSALAYYVEDASVNGSVSLGSASTTYISVPDPSATSTSGDQCQGLGVPSSSYAWRCEGSTYRKADSTGWIPVNFSSISVGSPLGQLPVDPANQTSTGLFYSYATNGSQYEVNAVMESQKYKQQFASNPQLPYYPEVAAQGTNLALSGLWNAGGLVGWWPLTEGTGTTALDQSGSGNNGTWNGSNPYYTASSKVGPYAGNFDGSTDYVNVPSSSLSLPNAANGFSVVAWENITDNSTYRNVVSKTSGNLAGPFDIYVNTGGNNMNFIVGNGSSSAQSISASLVVFGIWQEWAFVYNGASMAEYLNGSLVAGPTSVSFAVADTANPLRIGKRMDGVTIMKGLTDDVRVYSRALSAAEVQALYNAEK